VICTDHTSGGHIRISCTLSFENEVRIGIEGKDFGHGNSNWLSIASVFVQFMVASFFISCVVIIVAQLTYMHHVPLGFDKYNVSQSAIAAIPSQKSMKALKQNC